MILRITGSDTNSFGLTSDVSFLTVKYIGLINMNRLYYGIVFIEHDHRKCKPMVVVKVFEEEDIQCGKYNFDVNKFRQFLIDKQ